jgi:hypothetical protein
VGIELLFKISKFLEIACFKCQNLRKLQEKAKYRIWWKPKTQSTSTACITYPIIDNNFLCYNLLEHYVSPFLQKEAIKCLED